MLNSSEVLAVVEVAAYTPIALVAFYITLRYASTNRRKAWVFLLTLAIMRSVGATLSIVSQHVPNLSTGLLTAVKILRDLGPSLLLLATHALVSALTKKVLPSLSRFLQLVRLVIVVGMILPVIGGIRQALTHAESTVKTDHILFKTGIAILLVGYLSIFGVQMLLWTVKGRLPSISYKFLRNTSIAMPFLAARVLYPVLGAFHLASLEFSTTSGKWQIFSFIALLMEFIVVCIHLVSGITIPLNDEAGSYDQGFTRGSEPFQEMTSKPQYDYQGIRR